MDLIGYIDSKREEHLNDLNEFLRIPSVSAKSEHKPDIERAAKWVAERLRAAGLENVEIVPTKMHPLVYGESLHAPGKPTILFYGHYDVQPAEPLDLWTSPAFEPTIRDGNLYGRGTADDKGQVHIHIKALDALRKPTGKLPINVKVMIEGEEEVGSVSLWEFVKSHKEKLKADALVVSDTAMLAKGVPSITYGLRGLELLPDRNYGSGAGLALGSFWRRGSESDHDFGRDDRETARQEFPRGRSRVLRRCRHGVAPGAQGAQFAAVEGKGIPQDGGRAGAGGEKGLHDRRAALDAPDAGAERNLGRVYGRRRKDGDPVEGLREIFHAPGAESGSGEDCQARRTAHPQAAAENGEVQIRRCSARASRGWRPTRIRFSRRRSTRWRTGFGKRAVFIREGGSIPFVTQMHDTFKVPCVLLGFGLPDENAHAPDEHIALENYFGGIKAVALFYEQLATL